MWKLHVKCIVAVFYFRRELTLQISRKMKWSPIKDASQYICTYCEAWLLAGILHMLTKAPAGLSGRSLKLLPLCVHLLQPQNQQSLLKQQENSKIMFHKGSRSRLRTNMAHLEKGCLATRIMHAKYDAIHNSEDMVLVKILKSFTLN